MLHNRPLPSGQVKVSVATPTKGANDVKLPFPTEEVLTVQNAIGSFIAWPTDLVVPIKVS